jgi:hypothetical protein
MKGKSKGVQARIRQENQRAFFMPCGCHYLKFVVGDAAISCTETLSFLWYYTAHLRFIFCICRRWHFLKDNVPTFTLKPLCNTRWECRINCSKPLRYHISKTDDALMPPSPEPAVKQGALNLSQQIRDFSFLVMLII